MNRVSPSAPTSATMQRPWLFLAGAIDHGRTDSWRGQVASAFQDLTGTILDPYTDAWDSSPGPSAEQRRARQVAWELDGLEDADLILCWLPAGSTASISLLELGLHARRGRLVVGCPAGYRHHGNVRAVCQRHSIPLAASLADAMAIVRSRLASLTQQETS